MTGAFLSKKGGRLLLTGDLLDEALAIPGAKNGTFPVSALGRLVRLYGDSLQGEPVEEWRVRHASAMALPATLAVPDRADGWAHQDYQAHYAGLPATKRRLLCAADTGLGKAAMALLRSTVLGSKVLLVVGPPVVLPNWESEAAMVLGRKSGILRYHGSDRHNTPIRGWCITTTYDLLAELVDRLKVERVRVDHIVLDEAHLCSRKGNGRNKAVWALVRQYPRAAMQMLSGTPVLYGPADLYELVAMLDKEIAGTKGAWMSRYTEPVETREVERRFASGRSFTVTVATKRRPVNLDQLREHISPLLYVVDKDSRVQFKDLQEVRYLPMLPEQAEAYRRAAEELVVDWGSGRITIPNALARLSYLMGLAEDPKNVHPTLPTGSKELYLQYLIDECLRNGDTMVIWGRYKGLITRLYRRYKEQAVLFTGDLSPKERDKSLLSFNGVHNEQEQQRWESYGGDNRGPGWAPLLFGTLGFTQSIGVNMHKRTSKQIFPSFHLNPGVNEQARGRIARLGQEAEAVQTIYLVTEGSVEGKILRDVQQRWADQRAMIHGYGGATLEENQVDLYIGYLSEEL